ncbi:hypothetical protein NW837_02755, partial [Synechococcus sp. R6-10]|uniref:hypothetical protein n=1 Tax=Synechococcus sp. R6-10 TaxID=2291956 RepID=UPI0039C39694
TPQVPHPVELLQLLGRDVLGWAQGLLLCGRPLQQGHSGERAAEPASCQGVVVARQRGVQGGLGRRSFPIRL